jgi:hypothetical protein
VTGMIALVIIAGMRSRIAGLTWSSTTRSSTGSTPSTTATGRVVVVVVIVDRPAEQGSQARLPLSPAWGEGLFELRFTLGPTARRITSRFTKDGRIILSC